MIKYTAGSNKGNVRIGNELNSPFGIDRDNVNTDGQYTSAKCTLNGTNASGSAMSQLVMKWSPVIAGSIVLKVTASGTTTTYVDVDDAGTRRLAKVTGDLQWAETVDRNGNVTRELVSGTIGAAIAGTTVYLGCTRDANFDVPASYGTTNPVNGVITLAATGDGSIADGATYELTYIYDNAYVPANDVPVLNAKMEAIAMMAKPRRIAVFYSNLAAFQA